jgi:hypothetical protein
MHKYNFILGKPKGKRPFGNLIVERKIILK